MRSLLFVFLAAQLCAQTPQPGSTAGRGINFYSLQSEYEMGQNARARLEAALPVVHEPALDGYLLRLGQELAVHVPGLHPQFTFTVYDDRGGVRIPSVPSFPDMSEFPASGEALTLPGGPIFVPLTLLQRIPSEPQLAAVLAHAIGHQAGRHATRAMTRVQVAGLAAKGLPDNMRQVNLQLVAARKWSREFEVEADAIAVRLLAESGYDPAALTEFIQGLPAGPGGEHRIDALAALPTAAPTHKAATGDFDKIKRIAASL